MGVISPPARLSVNRRICHRRTKWRGGLGQQCSAGGTWPTTGTACHRRYRPRRSGANERHGPIRSERDDAAARFKRVAPRPPASRLRPRDGAEGAIEIVTTDVWAVDSEDFLDNPLGKIPVIVTADGTALTQRQANTTHHNGRTNDDEAALGHSHGRHAPLRTRCRPATEPIKIGMVVPLTGPIADAGRDGVQRARPAAPRSRRSRRACVGLRRRALSATGHIDTT